MSSPAEAPDSKYSFSPGGSLYHRPPDPCPRSHLANVCSIPQIWRGPQWQAFSRAPRAPGRLRSGCGRHEVSLRKGNSDLMCFLTRGLLFGCSTNGTYLNDTLIGKGNKRRLTHGDHLSLVMPIANRPDGTRPATHGPPLSESSAYSFPNRRYDI